MVKSKLLLFKLYDLICYFNYGGFNFSNDLFVCFIFVHFYILEEHLQPVSKSLAQIINPKFFLSFFLRKKHYQTKLLIVWSVNLTHQSDKTN